MGRTDGVLLSTVAVILRELTGILHSHHWARHGASRDWGSPIPWGGLHRRCVFLSLTLKTSRWGLRVLSELLEEQIKVHSQTLHSCLSGPATSSHSPPPLTC